MTPEQEAQRRAFLMHELRVLWLRLEGAKVDTEAVATALKAGIINPDQACGFLYGCGLLELLGEDSE
jgi:hypothetical protein